MQHLSRNRHGHTRVLALLAGLEINHEAQHLHSRRHEIRHPLDHVEQMMQLSGTSIRVLPCRVEILARTTLTIITNDHLLTGLLLRRDVLRRETLKTVLPTPCESCL